MDNNENNEADDESMEGDGNFDSESDKYLVPLEVQAQLQLLWRHHADILDFIWGRALRSANLRSFKLHDEKAINHVTIANKSLDSWKLFFINILLVPPSRFRPASVVGDATSDHPQNYHLSQVLLLNEKIAKLLHEQAQMKSINDLGFGSSILDSNDIKERDVGANSEFISKQVSAWIELQNAVNCYMDSSKDPNPLGSAGGIPSGIKQLLERKEGLFRKNMMGKRVNYCCRSVISPDPYIGTNEVGIPVRFAKTLHYPTPVTSWNVKLMRQLVENGPDEYPGLSSFVFYCVLKVMGKGRKGESCLFRRKYLISHCSNFFFL
jgi:DNA-directed RNA polymerase I subunit RPA1